MQLGLNLGYWGAGNDADNLATAVEADRLGYAVAWVAEAYGSDAPTVLAWVGAQTQRIDLGAGVMQIPARTPAMTAMTAATIDTLSGGRFRLGLGVSGPQVSEGWHGVPFAAPLGRTREYVDIVRMALRRETVAYQGKHWQLPIPDGPGKALKLIVHPVRPQVPIYLAAVGPKNLELAGEIADGWLPSSTAPSTAATCWSRCGPDGARPARGPRRTRWPGSTSYQRFRWSSTTTSSGPPGPSRATPRSTSAGWGRGSRTSTTSWPAGWGSRRTPPASRTSTSTGDPGTPPAAVPFEFIDATSLIGPRERIAERVGRYADAGVTTLTVSAYTPQVDQRLDMVRMMAELVT